MTEVKRGVCDRCGRKLTNPHSIARSLGPVCYKKSGGGIFDDDLNADEKEWKRREELLKAGGEVDFGCNWQSPLEGTSGMRVSVRYRDGAYEAYGHIFRVRGEAEEVIFARSTDLKLVYRKAVAAGPTCTAQAHWARKKAARALRGRGVA